MDYNVQKPSEFSCFSRGLPIVAYACPWTSLLLLGTSRAVAVKRLLLNSTQWADDFFNEVNLISGVEHIKLVKLYGCSITSPESLLVYQYVPNKSLHDSFFAQKNLHLASEVSHQIGYS